MALRVKRQPNRTRVSPKHQVTIPAAALKRAGLGVGDVLDVQAEHGRVVLIRPADQLEPLLGSMTGVWPAGWLDDLRTEWR